VLLILKVLPAFVSATAPVSACISLKLQAKREKEELRAYRKPPSLEVESPSIDVLLTVKTDSKAL